MSTRNLPNLWNSTFKFYQTVLQQIWDERWQYAVFIPAFSTVQYRMQAWTVVSVSAIPKVASAWALLMTHSALSRKSHPHSRFVITQSNVDWFSKFFHRRTQREFEIKKINKYYPLYFKRVVTEPCKILKVKGQMFRHLYTATCRETRIAAISIRSGVLGVVGAAQLVPSMPESVALWPAPRNVLRQQLTVLVASITTYYVLLIHLPRRDGRLSLP